MVSVVPSKHVHGLMMEQVDESNVERDYSLIKYEKIYFERERLDILVGGGRCPLAMLNE